MVWAFFIYTQVNLQPSLDLFRAFMSFHQQRELSFFAYLSFKKCDTPSFLTNIKGWKQKYFFLRPKSGSFLYSPMWHRLNIDSFNELVRVTTKLVQRVKEFRRVDS